MVWPHVKPSDSPLAEESTLVMRNTCVTDHLFSHTHSVLTCDFETLRGWMDMIRGREGACLSNSLCPAVAVLRRQLKITTQQPDYVEI